MPPTETQVVDAARAVVEPELHLPLGEVGLVRGAAVDGNRAVVTVGSVVADHPQHDELRARVQQAVAAVDGVADVDVRLEVLDDAERGELIGRLTARVDTPPGQPPIPFAAPGSRTRVLLVASGKGGVGKSSVSVNLAVSLARRGRHVALVDADVWGFSIPPMLGIDRPPTLLEGAGGERLILPPGAHGVTCASIGFFVREDQPVVWRGPMLHKALEQFLTDFWWGDPDFLVVDLPPGTGDISLSLAGFLPRAEAYVVTTPQPAAQRVAQRAGLMFQSEQIRIPVHGVIENMSWFTGDDGTRYELFGSGGGDLLARRLDVPLVGRVPLVPALREGGDIGRPITVSDPDGEAATAFAGIARRIDEELAPTRRSHPELRVV